MTGVRLTDGTVVLKDYKYIGKAEGLAKGIHLYVVEFEKHRSAFIWIDKDGTELLLPNCPEKVSFESAYVISGDVYTWKAVQPDHGVVQAMCIDNSWVKKAR